MSASLTTLEAVVAREGGGDVMVPAVDGGVVVADASAAVVVADAAAAVVVADAAAADPPADTGAGADVEVFVGVTRGNFLTREFCFFFFLFWCRTGVTLTGACFAVVMVASAGAELLFTAANEGDIGGSGSGSVDTDTGVVSGSGNGVDSSTVRLKCGEVLYPSGLQPDGK